VQYAMRPNNNNTVQSDVRLLSPKLNTSCRCIITALRRLTSVLRLEKNWQSDACARKRVLPTATSVKWTGTAAVRTARLRADHLRFKMSTVNIPDGSSRLTTHETPIPACPLPRDDGAMNSRPTRAHVMIACNYVNK